MEITWNFRYMLPNSFEIISKNKHDLTYGKVILAYKPNLWYSSGVRFLGRFHQLFVIVSPLLIYEDHVIVEI